MARAAVFICLCFIAMLAAAVFGALHNQISFTIGASYFYDVKFSQFGIDPVLRNRIGAAQVGALASWWMGLVMGGPAFLLGAVTQPGRRRYFFAGLSAIWVALAVTAIGTFLGLAIGAIADMNMLIDYLPFVDAFSDPEGFVRAALMHDATYLGGAAGALAALYVMWRARHLGQSEGE